MKTLTIRISDEEHALMVAAAAKRFMTITGMVRAHFHTIFEQDGILDQPKEQVKPQVIRVPIPTGHNAWRDEIYRRVKRGEDKQTVADSYGITLQVVNDKVKAAKIAELEGAVINRKELPVYAPVDPDNPTLDEQKVNAERARLRLQEMGLL